VIAVSIISHGHGEMVLRLVTQLLECPEISKIIVTLNIKEDLLFPESLKIRIIENNYPKGFGENHNFVFREITQPYFCPLNPDVRLLSNPFPQLITSINKYNADLVAPLVVNNNGGIEDSIRNFPTLFSVSKKIFSKSKGCCNIKNSSDVFSPEWVAGMFMFFRSSAYKKLKGFDEIFFLYYEDVDICIRLWRQGMKLIADPSVCVVHDARRASRNNFAHMKLHLKSMGIYFLRYFLRLPSINKFQNIYK